MIKKLTKIIGLILILATFLFFLFNKTHSPTTDKQKTSTNDNTVIDKNTVYYNGWLKTNGSKLENEKNETIQLRGVSSHGIEWFSDLITYNNLKQLKDVWHINTFRIAMYTDENGTGYVHNPKKNKDTVCQIIDMAVDLDMYVIVDWHILNDKNPQTHKETAKVFFEEISQKYADKPNVIYEICNEPNSPGVNWNGAIKPYAEEIIPIIRNNSPKSLIIVGTPNWCKDLNQAADNTLNFENIVYSCHFYAGSHGAELRDKIDYCIKKDVPVFVSECGLTVANGDGDVYFDKFNEWIDYLNSNNISWIYWSFSNKNESSAILSPDYHTEEITDDTTSSTQESGYPNSANNTEDNSNKNFDENNIENNDLLDKNSTNSIDFNDYLTPSGKFIKSVFDTYNH